MVTQAWKRLGSQYDGSRGDVEIQQKDWVIIHPIVYGDVSYRVVINTVGRYLLKIHTLAGFSETMPFAGRVYFDGRYIGDIPIHEAGGMNKVLIHEFPIDIDTEGQHTITVTNESLNENNGDNQKYRHIRLMELMLLVEPNMDLIKNNPQLFNANNKFVEALEEYLKELKEKKDPLYEQSFINNVLIEQFSIYVNYIKKYRKLKGVSVLDLGCGTGGNLVSFWSQGASVIGIEIDPDMLHLSSIRIKNNQNADCLLADGHSLPFESNSFDICICAHVIEHVDDPQKVVREIYRVLKPNGITLIEYPNRLYPIEQHSNLLFLTYLPLIIARIYAYIVERLIIVPKDYRKRLNIIYLLKYQMTYLSIKKLIKDLPIDILDTNPNDRFIMENPRLMNIPQKIKRVLSILFSRNVTVIFTKN